MVQIVPTKFGHMSERVLASSARSVFHVNFVISWKVRTGRSGIH